jgi:hypothetical protein
MSIPLVDRIANTMLYEGYMLYPYRPSVKNRQRWTFGGLYPRSYSEAQGGSDAWFTQTECLVRCGDRATLEVKARFLHLQARLVGKLEQPCGELTKGEEPPWRVVEQLQVGERLLHTWQEAVEREHLLAELDLNALAALRESPFALPAQRQLEPVRGPHGKVIAVLVREQQRVAGLVRVSATPVAAGLFKVHVRIENHTTLEKVDQCSRDEAQLRTLVSTHCVLGVRGGDFVSLLDPPAEWQALAGSCRNIGTWPVLVGEAGDKHTMLSSPIILYDYPQIAPESAGDLFDATEIDEILTLRILTMTDQEKQAMAGVDDRARALLERTEALANEQLLGMHGTIRGLRTTEDNHE